MELYVALGCAVFFTGLSLLWKGPLLAMAVEGDEDMKIVGGSASPPREDASELAAQQFLHQKSLGNIEKARALGEQYAGVLLTLPRELFTPVEEAERRHQQYLLYAYVVNRVIADQSPNSILAQTSLNVFYGTLETQSPEMYTHISDTAAFSLYILCERSNMRTQEEIGRTYAGLCGLEGDKALVDEGNGLYDLFYRYCYEKHQQIEYKES